MQIEFVAGSIKGPNHKNNNDRVLVEKNILFSDVDTLIEGTKEGKERITFKAVLCDGAGDDPSAAVAAKMGVTGFNRIDIAKCNKKLLENQIHVVNQAILDKREYKNLSASTLAGLLIYGDQFLSFNLGDSRIYKYENNELVILSEDHVKDGALSRYLGIDNLFCRPTIKRGSIKSEAVFLICSDGLYKPLYEFQIESILHSPKNTLKDKYCDLMSLAKIDDNDDKSVILVGITPY